MISNARRRSAATLMLSAGLLEFAYITYQIFYNNELSPNISLGVMLIVCVLSFLYTSFLAFGTPYLFSTAYLVPLLAFHFGLVFQHAMGIIIVSGWEGIGGYWIGLAGWYTLLAVTSIAIGVALYILMAKKTPIIPPKELSIQRNKNLLRIRSIGRGLFLASILLLIISIIQLGNIFAMSRFELFYGNHDTRAIGVFSMIFPTAALAIFISSISGKKRIISYFIAALAVALLMLSGYRSVVMFPMLIGAVIWVKLGKRIPLTLAIGMLISILLLIPIIGQLRAMGAYSDISLESFSKIGESAQASDSFEEMGRSVGILAYTLKAIPSFEDYRYGKTYWKYLKDSLPNLSGETNTDNARRTIYTKLKNGQMGMENMQPSDWATYHLLPTQFLTGGGVGFTAIGEPYMNFGFAGVVLFFMAMGVFLGRMDSVELGNSYAWMMFAIICYWNFLVTARNDFGVFIKPVLFTLIVAAIWKYIRRLVPFLDKF